MVTALCFKCIVSHCLPPDLATQFTYFTLIPSIMPPKVDKKNHVHLKVQQKLKFFKKLDENAVAICIVLSNRLQATDHHIPLLFH